jgi:transcriptional regulator with XRE-family HTH domain
MVDPIVKILIAERHRRGLSQRAVGRMLGLSSATLWTWEHGVSSPTLNNLRAWAAALQHELEVVPWQAD